jgi:hypothetical protein
MSIPTNTVRFRIVPVVMTLFFGLGALMISVAPAAAQRRVWVAPYGYAYPAPYYYYPYYSPYQYDFPPNDLYPPPQ